MTGPLQQRLFDLLVLTTLAALVATAAGASTVQTVALVAAGLTVLALFGAMAGALVAGVRQWLARPGPHRARVNR